jgi:hypothetical protein
MRGFCCQQEPLFCARLTGRAGSSQTVPGTPTHVDAGKHMSFRQLTGAQLKRITSTLLAVLMVLALLASLVVAGGASGMGCEGCHPQVRALAGAGEAPHTQISCIQCHAADRADRAGLGLHVLRSLLPMTAAGEVRGVVDDTCLGCHQDVLERTVQSDSLAIAHVTCVSRACRDCHAASLHGAAILESRTPSMDICLSCHATITSPDGCELCHIGSTDARADGSTSWRITHGVNWEVTHGAGDLTTCRYCHSAADDCTECHIDMPHPDDWTSDHGTGALGGRSPCAPCHRDAFCDGCHGIEMPHPKDWLPGHPTITNGYDDPVCVRCHMSEDCTACHVAHTHPGGATPDD